MSDRQVVPVIGIVGGIGSGKSALAELLARECGIEIVNGDRAGHRVLQETEIKQQIQDRFGDEVLDPGGRINRQALGRLVFGGDETHRRAKADLERIVHPRIGELISEQIAAARYHRELEGVILDAAILLETGWGKLCDAVVYIDVPEETRLRRVTSERGWSAKEFRAREASQAALTWKKEQADFVIENSGSFREAVKELKAAVDRVRVQMRKQNP